MKKAKKQIWWVGSLRFKNAVRRRKRVWQETAALVLAGAALFLLMTQGVSAIASLMQADAGSEQLYPLQIVPPYTVALDPGHGGVDSGAEAIVTETPVCEKTVDALFDLLTADPNYNPVRTRPNGEDRSTAQRVQVATENKASLLLSVHANCDSSQRTHGFECYPTPPGRVYSEQSMRFANCICEEMEKAGNKLRGSHGISFAYYNGKSKLIVPGSDTKVRKQKSFGMVDKTFCPSALVEQCFLTNYSDVENWAGDAGCTKAAGVYYRAICAYFGTVPLAEGQGTA